MGEGGSSHMIEESVVQRVLGSALRSGGEFAEVFAEDKRSSSARLDDRRGGEPTAGLHPRPRHRLVPRPPTGLPPPPRPSGNGLTTAAEAAAAAARGGGGGVREVEVT